MKAFIADVALSAHCSQSTRRVQCNFNAQSTRTCSLLISSAARLQYMCGSS